MRGCRVVHGLALGSLSVALLCGCGQPGDATFRPGGGPGGVGASCTAAAVRACEGPQACAGLQQCAPDGSGWGTCNCDGDAVGSGGAAAGGGDGDGDGGGDGDGDGDGDRGAFPLGDDPNRNRVTPGQICERLSTLQCAGEAFCCDQVRRDEASCRATMLAGCNSELMLDGILAEPSVGFDAERAFQAFTNFERMASNCDPEIARFGISHMGFAGMYLGTVAPGGDCGAAQPAGDVRNGAALISCTSPQTHACLPSLLSWTCSPKAGAGGDCFSDLNCSEGLFCDNPSLSIAGDACQARKADGQSCAAANHCQSLVCKDGACAAATSQTAYCLE